MRPPGKSGLMGKHPKMFVRCSQVVSTGLRGSIPVVIVIRAVPSHERREKYEEKHDK